MNRRHDGHMWALQVQQRCCCWPGAMLAAFAGVAVVQVLTNLARNAWEGAVPSLASDLKLLCAVLHLVGVLLLRMFGALATACASYLQPAADKYCQQFAAIRLWLRAHAI